MAESGNDGQDGQDAPAGGKKAEGGFSAVHETGLDGCRETALSLHGKGRPWHIHSLAPDCRFNPKGGRYAFAVEDETTGAAHVAFCEEQPRPLNLELLALLHGDDILSAAAAAGPDDPIAVRMIERTRDLCRRGARWHHHIFSPRCRLNPAPGSHTIALECPAEGLYEVASFEEEPRALLSAVERLYFGEETP